MQLGPNLTGEISHLLDLILGFGYFMFIYFQIYTIERLTVFK